MWSVSHLELEVLYISNTLWINTSVKFFKFYITMIFMICIRMNARPRSYYCWSQTDKSSPPVFPTVLEHIHSPLAVYPSLPPPPHLLVKKSRKHKSTEGTWEYSDLFSKAPYSRAQSSDHIISNLESQSRVQSNKDCHIRRKTHYTDILL